MQMAYFNYMTGVICNNDNMDLLLMCNGWTPYYTSYGRYVGCKCYTPDMPANMCFYNPASGRYIEFYEDLDW
jgi:hypothetical protein